MSNTDRDALLERWAIGMETLEQYYEGLYGPPATPATLPDVTNRDGMLEAIADGMERAQININKHSTTYHNTDTAYVKTVPAYVHEASIEKVGGRTIVMNQILKDPTMTDASNWTSSGGASNYSFTVTDNVLKVERVTETTTALSICNTTPRSTAITGHKYYCRATLTGSVAASDTKMQTRFIVANTKSDYLGVETTPKTFSDILVAGSSSPTVNGVNIIGTTFTLGDYIEVSNLNIIDLTQMFGSGNEPSTAAEFEAMLPVTSIDYNTGELLSAGVTDVVSKDGNDTTIDTYSIPAEIQALTGYGWSCPDHYNYIDFETKKYVQEVDSRAYEAGDESDSTVVTDGTTTHYALSPAVETDVSAYLTDDNLIEVESGGTLTFPNSNGDDCRIPVPSTETFWVS